MSKDHAISLMRSFSMVDRLDEVWDIAQMLDSGHVAGAFVEAGVWKGGVVGMMALAHLETAAVPMRELVLLDSFEGMPAARPEVDGDEAPNHTGTCLATIEDTIECLVRTVQYPDRLISWYPGWFKDTLRSAAAKIGPIAFLRLDCDWYDSVQECLGRLYPLLTVGGVLSFDDYYHWPGCKRAVDEWLVDHRDYLEPIPMDRLTFRRLR